MFPDITRDEVFRIETPRLWLRWPMLADAGALARRLAKDCQGTGSRLAHANAQAIETMIGGWREDMAAGSAMHLVLVPKTGARDPIGIIHVSPTSITSVAPDSSFQGIEAEARRAVGAMLALLGVPTPFAPGEAVGAMLLDRTRQPASLQVGLGV